MKQKNPKLLARIPFDFRMKIIAARTIVAFGLVVASLSFVHAEDAVISKEKKSTTAKTWTAISNEWSSVSLEALKRGAEQNDPAAQYFLAWKLNNGENTVSAESLQWLKRAAEQGLAPAQMDLGYRYAEGDAVERNLAEAARLYRLAAEQGHSMAQNNLGYLYLQGRGVEKNLDQALKWYRKSAEQGNPYGEANLGWMYENGVAVAKDIDQAKFWYRKAADQDFPKAEYLLGQLTEHDGISGDSSVGNFQVASEWYQKAAKSGSVEAMLRLGELYYYGKLDRNYAAAAKWFRAAADRGSDRAVMNLAELYRSNRPNFPQNHIESARWYRVAAEKGDPEAQFWLGTLLVEGVQIQHNEAEAEQWLRKALENGYAEAATKLVALKKENPEATFEHVTREELLAQSYNGSVKALPLLAHAYENGIGGAVDSQTAAEVYWRILNQGAFTDREEAARNVVNLYAQRKLKFDKSAFFSPRNPEELAKRLANCSRLITSAVSQFQIGEMFASGEFLPKDMSQAVQWFTKAAKGGNIDALNRIGELWAAGLDGEPNWEEAFKWEQSAAMKGHAAAQLHLARAYQNGRGVATDSIEAAAWFDLAVQQKLPEAEPEFTKLKERLTTEQIEKAKRRSEKLAESIAQVSK
jgi:TPR repeat protein